MANAGEDKSFRNLGLFIGHHVLFSLMLVTILNNLEIIRGLTQYEFISFYKKVFLVNP